MISNSQFKIDVSINKQTNSFDLMHYHRILAFFVLTIFYFYFFLYYKRNANVVVD